MMNRFSSGPWRGESKIIIGIDLGTTQSAVSFAYLFEGGAQTVQHVNEWPGQGAHKGTSKIPTLVYYDQNNKPTCFGAEALKPENQDRAEDEGWSLAKHFKLHLHPQSMAIQDRLALCPLPPGVSLAAIYTDFLGYLLRHTQGYFESHVIQGAAIWEKYSPKMLVVLAHPNGWSTREQNYLRQALRNVGPNYKSCQITFVTEGEASVHFCMFSSNMDSALQPDTDLIVCDAGGSTIDTIAYRVEQTTPLLQLKERKASACIQAGGVFVDMECQKYLEELLSNTDLEEEDIRTYVSAGVKDFEETAKKEFASPSSTQTIDLRDTRLKRSDLGIKRGRITLSGSITETFFIGDVSSTIESVRQQASGLSPKHILLVGGFGESLYLRRQLSDEFTNDGCQITIIQDSSSKAAADGAVIWAAKLAVVGRVTRVAYGTLARARYDPSNPDHQGRSVIRSPQGHDVVLKLWSEIIQKGVVLSGQETARREYFVAYNPSDALHSELSKFTTDIWAFHEEPSKNPGWVRNKEGDINHGFEKLCKVEADLTSMKSILKRKHGDAGAYDVLQFFLAIELGGTEICARIEWVENGVLRSGPVKIIPEPVDLPPAGKNMRG